MKRIWRELAFWAGGFAARNGRFDRYGGFAWPVGCRSPPLGSLHSAPSLEAVGVDGGIIANETVLCSARRRSLTFVREERGEVDQGERAELLHVLT